MQSATEEIEAKGRAAKAASKKLARCSTEVKNRALSNIADGLTSREEEILAANRQDYEKAEGILVYKHFGTCFRYRVLYPCFIVCSLRIEL